MRAEFQAVCLEHHCSLVVQNLHFRRAKLQHFSPEFQFFSTAFAISVCEIFQFSELGILENLSNMSDEPSGTETKPLKYMSASCTQIEATVD